MIRINNYIFNENEIVKIQFDDGSKEMEIDHKNGNRTFIDGTFEDIEWNYEQRNIKDDEYIELSNKYQRLSNRNEELEEKNRIFEDCNFDLNRQIEKLEEENKKFNKIKEYIKENEEEFGSLLDNEKTILRIIDGEE